MVGSELKSKGREADHGVSPTQILFFKIAHNPWVRKGYYLVCFILLLLAFVEKPSRNLDALWPKGSTCAIEIVCLLCIAAETFAKFQYMGRAFW